MQEFPEKTASRWGKIGNRILAGFLLIVPIVMTIWIAAFLYDLLTDWAAWILKMEVFEGVRNIFGFETIVRLFSLILVLGVLFCIGTIAKYAIGKRILTIMERGILKIPMLNMVYSTAQQLIDAIRNPSAGMFRKVVLFEYPRKGLFVIGFVTNENNNNWELNKKTGQDLISVFLPTTPNPTSGFLLFVPREECIVLEMGIAQGMRLVISGGAVGPHVKPQQLDDGLPSFLAAEHIQEAALPTQSETRNVNNENPIK